MQFSFSYFVFTPQVGAALNFDVLKYDEDTVTALLRVYSRWPPTMRERGLGGVVGTAETETD